MWHSWSSDKEADAQRDAWLKTVKAGDEVGVQYTHGYGSEEQWVKVTVKRVTPTGRIVTTPPFGVDDWTFVNGMNKGGNRHYLVPWTEEIDKAIARRNLVNGVWRYLDRGECDIEKVRAMSDEDLTKLRAFLRTLKRDKAQ